MKHYSKKDLTETYKFVQAVKEQCNKGIDEQKTSEQIQEEIASMCTKCLLPYNKDCEICNGLTEISNQLSLNLE